ncbi:hypothetical protein C1701_07200 [Actinoalloteichus sp. AHMU CJ021]|uniref:Uncharacterized protein n=1 Tax=Actinoalloteichus caeruleus DSM 43889 TaxID=1120930 RepID=A0ABT1JIC0_ACTCY|nr:hypothetical protein [Actinoalloteichus caeruleus]AUS78188.1 hypothetical protein C1701_07200 [Actinoalloteichus sp. AHMU CJ021]MCP2332223.1 hypothetical protein [Actinoalloteichus caeruleus DSM 43889]
MNGSNIWHEDQLVPRVRLIGADQASEAILLHESLARAQIRGRRESQWRHQRAAERVRRARRWRWLAAFAVRRADAADAA